MAQANSLREICGGKLNHLGVEAAPGKSNLSYANQHRDPEIFKALFFVLLKHCDSMVVCDYEMLYKWNLNGIDFITRLKGNATRWFC